MGQLTKLKEEERLFYNLLNIALGFYLYKISYKNHALVNSVNNKIAYKAQAFLYICSSNLLYNTNCFGF